MKTLKVYAELDDSDIWSALIQFIIDTKTKRNIGNLINIKNPNNHFDLGRFDLEKKIENCNENNDPVIPIKMSMFETDEKHDLIGVLLSRE